VIEGVRVDPLRQIKDERGAVYHMLRADDPAFEKFGEIYFSLVHPGWVKGWHLHTKMTLNYAVPVGSILVVLYDARDGSATKGRVEEIRTGEDDYKRIRIPPGVWNGVLGLGERTSVVANCATLPHDPDELKRLPPTDRAIPYSWPVKEVKGS
jgi:dTDP-4-dehydrorhamnose 3,5-epimerase